MKTRSKVCGFVPDSSDESDDPSDVTIEHFRDENFQVDKLLAILPRYAIPGDQTAEVLRRLDMNIATGVSLVISLNHFNFLSFFSKRSNFNSKTPK